ncbi:hypothetical protein PR048_016363 [Dryococelus australis]|uniref:Uncharacterized protein n=1 Tax=Dryococelus australis TaxID=614101 RepID=A0ABQ9HJH5_9NEOP|nr:hypothetical protein PR048_016363 [Dryococelus australis]
MIVVVDLILPGISCGEALLFRTSLPLCYAQTWHCLPVKASSTTNTSRVVGKRATAGADRSEIANSLRQIFAAFVARKVSHSTKIFTQELFSSWKLKQWPWWQSGKPARLPPWQTGFNSRPGHYGSSQVGIVPDDAATPYPEMKLARIPAARASKMALLASQMVDCRSPISVAKLVAGQRHSSLESRWGKCEMSMEQRRNARAGETGDPRKNPPRSSIVRHDSHVWRSGSGPAENLTQFIYPARGAVVAETGDVGTEQVGMTDRKPLVDTHGAQWSVK